MVKAPYQQLEALLTKSNSLISDYLGAELADKVTKEIHLKIEKQQLHLMLYGAYNAGKSSLINVLLGEKQAKEGDIPTTDTVDCFDWQGIKVFDTPGVNAPIEHENVTSEQVKRTNVLLFVIREGDTDSKDIYDRLFNLINRDKKVFIVLNHQAQSLTDIRISHQKVIKILSQYAEKHNLEESLLTQIVVYPINIKTAFTAIKKSSDKLLKHSGYLDFIEAFNTWVNTYNNKEEHFLGMQKHIQETLFNPLLSEIEKKANSNENGELSVLNSQLSTLKNNKRVLIQSSANLIRQEINLIKPEIQSLLKSCQDETSLNSSIQGLISPVLEQVENWLAKEIETVNAKLHVIVENNPTLSESQESSSPLGDMVYNAGKEALTGAEGKENITKLLLEGRKLKIPFLKGKWASTLGKYAGKAAIALQVVLVLFDAYKAGEQEDKLNAQNRQYALELQQATESIATSIISSLDKSVIENIEHCFDGNIEGLEEKINNLKINLSSVQTDLQLAKELNMQLESIRFS